MFDLDFVLFNNTGMSFLSKFHYLMLLINVKILKLFVIAKIADLALL